MFYNSKYLGKTTTRLPPAMTEASTQTESEQLRRPYLRARTCESLSVSNQYLISPFTLRLLSPFREDEEGEIEKEKLRTAQVDKD